MLTRWLTFTAFLVGSADPERAAIIGRGSLTVAPTCRVKGHPEAELTLNCGDEKNAGVVQYWHTPFGDLQTPGFHSKLDPVFMHHDGRLVVPNTSILHSGMYYCVLHHTEGTTLWTYELHVGPDSQYKQRDAFRFRRDVGSVEERQAGVSVGQFAGAVVASVLLTFVVGFSAGALSRTHVLRCLGAVTSRLRSPRQRRCDGPEVSVTTLPPMYDNQAFEMEQVLETTSSSSTTSPPAKPQRSFRQKRPEEQETTAYLEGCDYMKEKKEEEEEEEEEAGRSLEEKNKGCDEEEEEEKEFSGFYLSGDDGGSQTDTEEDGEEKDGRESREEKKEQRQEEEEVEEADEQENRNKERRGSEEEEKGMDEKREEEADEQNRNKERRGSEEEEKGRDGKREEEVDEQENRNKERRGSEEEKGRDEKDEKENKERRGVVEGEKGMDEKREVDDEEKTRREEGGETDDETDDETGSNKEEDTIKNGVIEGGGETSLSPGRRSRVIRLYQYDEDGQRYGHLPDSAPDQAGPAPRLKQRSLSLTRLNAIMAAASAGPLDTGETARGEKEERPHFHMEI